MGETRKRRREVRRRKERRRGEGRRGRERRRGEPKQKGRWGKRTRRDLGQKPGILESGRP